MIGMLTPGQCYVSQAACGIVNFLVKTIPSPFLLAKGSFNPATGYFVSSDDKTKISIQKRISV